MFREKLANHRMPTSEFLALEMRYQSLPPPLLSDGIPDQEDRKLGVQCRSFGLQQCQLIDQGIQGRPKIVGNAADMDAPLKRRWRTARAYAVDVIAGLWIQFRPDNVILGYIDEDILKAFEFLDFTLCTSYLETWAIQRMHMLYSLQEQSHVNQQGTKTEDARTTSGKGSST